MIPWRRCRRDNLLLPVWHTGDAPGGFQSSGFLWPRSAARPALVARTRPANPARFAAPRLRRRAATGAAALHPRPRPSIIFRMQRVRQVPEVLAGMVKIQHARRRGKTIGHNIPNPYSKSTRRRRPPHKPPGPRPRRAAARRPAPPGRLGRSGCRRPRGGLRPVARPVRPRVTLAGESPCRPPPRPSGWPPPPLGRKTWWPPP